MPYEMCDGLTYCRVDSHLIFMDVHNDRYFRLPATLEQAFTAVIDGQDCLGMEVGQLISKNILVETESIENEAVTPAIRSPSRSAIEDERENCKFHIATCIEVLAIVASTRHRLKMRKLSCIIDQLVAYRKSNAYAHDASATGCKEPRLLQAAQAFRHARLYVPIKTSCLLDSLSLTRFLSRRSLPASIVFGVTLNPFTAHCWVQAGDLVLNETIGDANSHTPIRIV